LPFRWLKGLGTTGQRDTFLSQFLYPRMQAHVGTNRASSGTVPPYLNRKIIDHLHILSTIFPRGRRRRRNAELHVFFQTDKSQQILSEPTSQDACALLCRTCSRGFRKGHEQMAHLETRKIERMLAKRIQGLSLLARSTMNRGTSEKPFNVILSY